LKNSGLRIHITGVVQGVGFRPFVYSLARRLDLAGWVRNTSAGVDIELDGPQETLDQFAKSIVKEAPPLARIDDLVVTTREPDGFNEFKIILSETIEGAFQPISPDVCVCADCLRELYDPEDRRYRYPFINCTNCGPRFTIIENIPYDRPFTTMAPFELCAECAAEYRDPLDRRFHAQPVACPVCGPQVWLEYAITLEDRTYIADDAIREARRLLQDGMIVAVKGLGGFHLACDATNAAAVDKLRARKMRIDKPFAVMMLDAEVVSRNCKLNDAEQRILESHERPIVVLDRLLGSSIVADIAPGQNTVGVMLPYTPLHYLLLEPDSDFPQVLVMTSGNLSEEPIATQNDEAKKRLSGLADAYLLHDRGIRTRCDDSVVRFFESRVDDSSSGTVNPIYPLRRSRGYAPFPIRLANNALPILATGAELKNAFCLIKDR